MLPMVQKVFFNALEKPENREMQDLSKRELVILTPMLALMIWIGFNPTPFLERMEPSVNAVLEQVNGSGSHAREGQGAEVQVTLTDPNTVVDFRQVGEQIVVHRADPRNILDRLL